MRQNVTVVLATLLVLALGYLVYRQVFDPESSVELTVLSVQGDVRFLGAEGVEAAAAGLVLKPQEGLSTGAAGGAVLGVGEGTRLTLEENSSLRVLEVDRAGVRIELEEGRVSARVRRGSTAVGLSSRGRLTRTEDGEITAVASADGALAVEVAQGSATVTGVEGVTALAAGERLRAPPGAQPSVSAIPEQLLLAVAWPPSEALKEEELILEGDTDPYAVVRVARASQEGGELGRATADATGHFRLSIPLQEGENPLQVSARDVMGAEVVVQGEVRRESPSLKPTKATVLWGP